MSTYAQHARPRASADASPTAKSLEYRLHRFRPEIRERVRSIAARHPWIADLAASFPALLVALAFPRPGANAQAAIQLVMAGAPLPACANAASVAMWLRGLPAEALSGAIPQLPDGIEFRRRIANLKPSSWRLGSKWLQTIADASTLGDEEIALWFAREAPLVTPKRKHGRKPRDRRRLLSLWAWHSRHALQGEPSLPRTQWNSEIKWKAAVDAALTWRDDLALGLYVGASSIEDVWLEPGVVDGYAFSPLLTASDIEAEAIAMTNCVRGYGSSIAGNDYRLWSVRKNGERIATLCLRAGYPDGPLPCIYELAGAKNAPASVDVWRAARRWVVEQDHSGDVDRLKYKDAKFNVAAWRHCWRRYWLTKRRIPDCLPLTPNENCFFLL